MIKNTSPLRFAPFAVWLILIYILLTLPGKDFADIQNITDSIIPNFDKIVHIGLFGGLVFWFGFALIRVNKEKTKKITIIIAVISCLYGIGMEYVQKYFTNHTREFSYGDMAADAVGAIIGYFFTRWITAKYQSHRKKIKKMI
jgi:VanZ family protein